ncbi:unnamed protein product [Paramecium octaurelia]|uniref:Uncharacterized protein n=1 Tax=Paramecium octaurelia TaxID=43137 RepID=A0A8S1V3E5_PAROT|nr:unnamed protein product [Paramecium octaurelia]
MFNKLKIINIQQIHDKNIVRVKELKECLYTTVVIEKLKQMGKIKYKIIIQYHHRFENIIENDNKEYSDTQFLIEYS